MRIKMITLECGPFGVFPPGIERDVSDDYGRQLVDGRNAIDISPREKAVVMPAEKAVIAVPERAVISPAEKRGRRR